MSDLRSRSPCYRTGPITYHAPIADMRPPTTAKIRIIHSVSHGAEVDGYFDGKKVFGNFPYKRISDYLEVPAGKKEAVILLSATNKEVIRGTLDLQPGRYYTLLVYGHVGVETVIKPLLLVDNLTCPPRGNAFVRLIHATTGGVPVDVVVNGKVTFPDVEFGSIAVPVDADGNRVKSEYALVPLHSARDQSNALQVTVYRAGVSGDIISGVQDSKGWSLVGPIDYQLKDGGVYTVVTSGILNDKDAPLSVIFSEDTHGSCLVYGG